MNYKTIHIRNLRQMAVLPFIVFIIILATCKSIVLNAQPVTVNASTNKSRVLIGEPFWLTLEVKTTSSTQPPTFKIDSIPHFEILLKDSSSISKQTDTTVYRRLYQLISFDSGRWVIPPFTLRPFVKTNSVLVDVVYTDNFDSQLPYHSIKDIKEVPFTMNENLEHWWYWIAIGIIVIILVIHWMSRTKRTSPKKVVDPSIHSFQKAIHSLSELKKSHLDPKTFCIQLSTIFRMYVAERTGVSSMQQTSNHLVEKVVPFLNDEIKHQQLFQALQLCDWVKFAKYIPEEEEISSAWIGVHAAVQTIETKLKK